ncbi:MAG: hypothetical protein J6X38_07915 [Abditibacteriota bacterium]|nr:hypothetical protein [Abditibacteriota bacterium]
MREDLGEYEESAIKQRKSKNIFDEDIPDFTETHPTETTPEETPKVEILRDEAPRRDAAVGSPYPPEVYQPDWGAFLLTPIWALANNVLFGLLWFVPFIGWIIPFILLFKGGELSWRCRRFESVEQFTAVRRAWTIAGIVFHLFWIVLFTVIVIVGIFAGETPPPQGQIS